jgi:SulP family sulfate permease
MTTSTSSIRFNRLELAGSLGDLGTLLPLAIGMIMVNGLSPSGLFLAIGVFYVFAGLYYRVTVPVQPMKVIGAYAIATGLGPSQITASGLLVAIVLLLVGATGAVNLIGKYTPKPVIRGVQLATGTVLMAQGIKFVLDTSTFQAMAQAGEPYLSIQSLGVIPTGLIIGTMGMALTLCFLNDKRFPAGILVILFGLLTGLFFGTHEGFNRLELGIHLPDWLPFGFPSTADFSLALITLVLPQIPMTLGNAVVANADLSREYFGPGSRKVTYKGLCISMGLANVFSFLVGGMPLCHGAGGLAAHYRFGARTAGSNLIIGGLFIGLALFLGTHAITLVHLIPFAVLGVLLIFAGSQLAMTIRDVKGSSDLFVIVIMLAMTLATNLAVGFGVGIVLAYALKAGKVSV